MYFSASVLSQSQALGKGHFPGSPVGFSSSALSLQQNGFFPTVTGELSSPTATHALYVGNEISENILG